MSKPKKRKLWAAMCVLQCKGAPVLSDPELAAAVCCALRGGDHWRKMAGCATCPTRGPVKYVPEKGGGE